MKDIMLYLMTIIIVIPLAFCCLVIMAEAIGALLIPLTIISALIVMSVAEKRLMVNKH